MSKFLGLRGNRLNVAAILGVLMPGIMSVGYNAASLGGALTMANFETEFPDIDIDDATNQSYTSTIQGTVVAVYAVGGFLGTFSCIWLGDILGRRRVIMTASIIQILGAILTASACSLAQLVISRVVIGIGTGALLATIPLWQSEISPAEKRGSHVVTKGIFSGVGCALALFLEYGMSFTKKSVSWRFPSAFPILLSVVVWAFAWFLPESPRWLIRKGRVQEARDILAALENSSVEDLAIESRVMEMQKSLNLAGERISIRQLFQMGPQRTLHRAGLAVAVFLFLQFTGATVTTFYSMCNAPSTCPRVTDKTTSNIHLPNKPRPQRINLPTPGRSLPTHWSNRRRRLRHKHRRIRPSSAPHSQHDRQCHLPRIDCHPRIPSSQHMGSARRSLLPLPLPLHLHHRIRRYPLSLCNGDCTITPPHNHQQYQHQHLMVV